MKKYLPFLPAAIGVLALIMIFLPAISVSGADTTYNGFTAIFGGENIFAFSFMNMLTYTFVIGAIVCNILYVLKKKQVFAYIVAGCFLMATIFFFCTVEFAMFKGYSGAVADVLRGYLDLGAGSIIAAILCIIGTILSTLVAFGGIIAKKLLEKIQNQENQQ